MSEALTREQEIDNCLAVIGETGFIDWEATKKNLATYVREQVAACERDFYTQQQDLARQKEQLALLQHLTQERDEAVWVAADLKSGYEAAKAEVARLERRLYETTDKTSESQVQILREDGMQDQTSLAQQLATAQATIARLEGERGKLQRLYDEGNTSIIELEQQLQAARGQYLEGVIFGLSAFAWWKDGTQYVGTCGTTLKAAIEKAKEGKLYGQAQAQAGGQP